MKYLKLYNESIRDKMTPKSKEEILLNKEQLLLNAGYRKEIKKDILSAIEKEMSNPFNKFGNSALGTLKYFIEDDFNFGNDYNNGVRIIINDVMKPLIKKYNLNESVRDKMTPKSEEEMRASIDTMLNNISNLTPQGMIGKLIEIEDDWNERYPGVKDVIDIPKLREIAEKKVVESEKELDKIFESLPKDEDLKKLVPKVNEWITKYGGNAENMESYGFTGMAEQIWDNGVQWRHDVETIYDSTVFESFKQLLKNVAKCETRYNNIDYDHI